MRCGLVALAGVFATRVAFAQDAGLSVDTGSPDALCPELASTRDAVRRRLGELVVPSGSGWKARYTIGHAPAGAPRDFVRLELYGPEGALQLSRDLPLEGESCSTMAEVIALVLDRYFRALLAREPVATGGTAGDDSHEAPGPQPAAPAPATLAPGAPAAAPSPAPSIPAPASAEPPTPAEPQGATTGFGLHYVGIEAAFRKPDRPALGARGLFELWPHTYAGAALLVGLLEDSEPLPDGGEATSREATLRGFLAWGPELGSVRTYFGPGLRLTVARGAGRGLPDRDVGYRATWGAGLDVGLLWATQSPWSIAVNAALDVSIAELGGRFIVENVEVLEPDLVRGWFGVGVGYAFGP